MINWVCSLVPWGIRPCKKRPLSLLLRRIKAAPVSVPARLSPVALLKAPPRLRARHGRVIGDPPPPKLVTGGREDGINNYMCVNVCISKKWISVKEYISKRMMVCTLATLPSCFRFLLGRQTNMGVCHLRLLSLGSFFVNAPPSERWIFFVNNGQVRVPPCALFGFSIYTRIGDHTVLP